MKRALVGALVPLLMVGALLYIVLAPPAPERRSKPRAEQPVPFAAVHAAPEVGASYWPADAAAGAWTGKLVRLGKDLAVLTVRGSAVERGTAHGKLLPNEVKAVVDGVRKYLKDDDGYESSLKGARVMRGFIDADVVEELDACAAAANVDKEDLLVAQLFGDVARAMKFRTFCSAFAAFGEATAEGKLIVGRNFDYAGFGLEEGLPLILQEIPTGEGAGRPFITIGYAGILNGWTAMNSDGLCASNNTLFNGADALEGMATCFLLRKIVERGKTVEDGVKIVEDAKRACTTGMLIAGKNNAGEWDARFVEFDSKSLAVVKPERGVVLSTNSRQQLPEGGARPDVPRCPRFQALQKRLGELKGKLTFDDPKHNVVAERDVYMGINLHCALLDPAQQRIRLAVKSHEDRPAAANEFRSLKVKAEGVEVEK